MKPRHVFICGEVLSFDVPLWDPMVAAHFESRHGYADEVLRQINEERLYERYFDGRRNLVFLDLGANIGLVSIHALQSCQRIVAVEPAPDAYAVLKAMTHAMPKIETIQAAIAPHDGRCEFYVNDINSTANSTVNTAGVKTSVRGVTLTNLLKEAQLTHVDFCKVDIEGAEGESLNMAELGAAKDIVDSYFIETHNCPKTTWEHKLGEIVGNLARCGYRHMEINGMGVYARK